MRRNLTPFLTIILLAGCGGAASKQEKADGDLDNDGVSVGKDCNDRDASVHAGAEELAYDGVDQDCDGYDLVDVDGDGHDGQEVGGDDCDDHDAALHPGVVDVCDDGIDQDCSGSDLDCNLVDQDGDEFTPAYGDCDDTDVNVHPGAAEIVYNGKDDDCSKFTRDDDIDADGYDHVADCDDARHNVHPGAVDTPYDGIDQDCSGGDLVDVDGDGAAAEIAGGNDCNDHNPAIDPGEPEIPYNGIDNDCNPATPDDDVDGDGLKHLADCDDNDAERFAGNPEIPYDGKDQDCTGADLTDVDLDGHDAIMVGGDDCDDDDSEVNPTITEVRYNAKDDDCDPSTLDDDIDQDGFALADDCDDEDPTRSLGFAEIAYDGIDQDCTGHDLTDVDGDWYASTMIDGGKDCDDDNADIHPGAKETFADGIDQNCDGFDAIDKDGDGYAGTATGGDDCNDADDAINPGEKEVCDNAVDEDCSGKANGCRYSFDGVAHDVDPDDLDGWELCYSDTYNDEGTAVPLEDCTGKYIMMACRKVGDDLLHIAANGPYDDVFNDTGDSDANTTTNSNGVEWYFNDDWSWGFAAGGASVNKDSCDFWEGGQADPGDLDDRLCWHTQAGALDGGYRCGQTARLNGSNDWERLVYQTDEEP